MSLLPKYRIRYGTCVLPSRPITKGEYTASFELHKVPRKWYEHIFSHSIPFFPEEKTDPIDTVTVLKIQKHGKPIHYEVWAPYLRSIDEPAHANTFPYFGKYSGQKRYDATLRDGKRTIDPSRDNFTGNYLIQHADQGFGLVDERWKIEILKRLQKQGKCKPEPN